MHRRRAVQSLGLLLGLAGLGLGFVISGGWAGRFPTHRNLGLSATVLGVAQLSALAWRPKPWSAKRRVWNQAHWCGGGSGGGLAAAWGRGPGWVTAACAPTHP